MRRIMAFGIAAVLLSIAAAIVYADNHEVRYTPSNEAYGACRSHFPYSHVEDCARDYDFLMMFWLRYRESVSDATYDSCEEAQFAGERRTQGSVGTEVGFPVAMVPGAPNGDGDNRVCEVDPSQVTPVPTRAMPTETPTAQATTPQPVTESCIEGLVYAAAINLHLEQTSEADIAVGDLSGNVGAMLIQIEHSRNLTEEFIDFLESTPAPSWFSESPQLLLGIMRSKVQAIDKLFEGDAETFVSSMQALIPRIQQAGIVVQREVDAFQSECT